MKRVPAASSIGDALEWLRAGGVVAFPTESFYGFGVDAQNSSALRAIVELKGRDQAKPFPLIVPNVSVLRNHVSNIPKYAETLMKKFWPGPLTLIFPSKHLSPPVANRDGGIGVRISAHPYAFELASSFGDLITATSANRARKPPFANPDEVEREFSHDDVLLVDAGPTPGGLPSTVLDCTDPREPRRVREGAIPWKEIACLL